MNGVIVVNLFAWRTSNPRELKDAAKENDIVGELNNKAIEAAIREAKITVAAWGNWGRLLSRGEEIASMIRGAKCLSITKRNHPRHPRGAKTVAQICDLLDFAAHGLSSNGYDTTDSIPSSEPPR